MCVPGGFGVRGIEGKVGALRHAREHRIPTLGLCLGLQCMVIEYARHVAGLDAANSTEFDPATPYPVIATMEDQREIVAGVGDLGGTMRLGLYPAKLLEGSLVRDLYGEPYVEERHRHRYEVANVYRGELEDAGIVFSGTSPGWTAGGVRRVGARRPPVLRRHAGPPRVPIATHPTTSAVRRPGGGGHRARRGPYPGGGSHDRAIVTVAMSSGASPINRVDDRWWRRHHSVLRPGHRCPHR